jgi:hypothetical protein
MELCLHSSIFPHDMQMDNINLFNPFKSEMHLYFTLTQNLHLTLDRRQHKTQNTLSALE